MTFKLANQEEGFEVPGWLTKIHFLKLNSEEVF